jgi:glycine/D-amino acid oxidase-like deaminating enzyme
LEFPLRTTNTLVIGAGQAGLAASRLLADRGHEHVLLERGSIGHCWRTATLDSLHRFGCVTTGLLNALVAEQPPRPGSVFLEVSWRFLAPVGAVT